MRELTFLLCLVAFGLSKSFFLGRQSTRRVSSTLPTPWQRAEASAVSSSSSKSSSSWSLPSVRGVATTAVEVSAARYADEEEEEGEEGEGEGEEEEKSAPVILIDDASSEISPFKEGISFADSNINGSEVRVGIIMARWNADIISGLYKGVNESLIACGVKPSNVFATYVPGAFELPVTARLLAMSKRVDVIICLGCLIKGDTMHFEYIAQATANGIMQVSLESYVPCIFGVLTVLNKDQAMVRSTGTHNEGLSWGKSAVEMGLNRMSALGMGSMKPKEAADKVAGMVVFKELTKPPAALPGSGAGSSSNNETKSSNNETSTKESKRKFGF